MRRYRDGGVGLENVLTAEVLLALDFLPRTAFFGNVLKSAHGAEVARACLLAEIEDAQATLLPGPHLLAPASEGASDFVVQPDALLTSKSSFCLVEAKRIRRSSFQPEQLARELVLTMRDAGERKPLLLLILGHEPPVPVKGHGRLAIRDAIASPLPEVLARARNHQLTVEGCLAALDNTVAWTTWASLRAVVAEQTENYTGDPSTKGTVRRLAHSVLEAIDRHA